LFQHSDCTCYTILLKQIYDKWFIDKRFKHKGDNSYTAIKWIELKKFKVVRYWVSERLLVYAKWAFFFRDQFRQNYSYKWSWDYLRNGILKWPTVPPMSNTYWSIVYENIHYIDRNNPRTRDSSNLCEVTNIFPVFFISKY
jgi:hypothetical protein